ncbi:MAG: type 2 isopentenyl-diphosphate Delta-isomerase [Pseudomonadota bacterium]|nr:type 2 isopentenyl-diphosphate Delta-isomerase [Pseudomonadota bacterium]
MPDPKAPPIRSDIAARKADHIALCVAEDVGFQGKTTLFEDVELIHDALPELALDQVDLSCTFAGRSLRAPLFIAAMTGGTAQAEAINRDLAIVAEALGVGLCFGSQRPLLMRGIRDGYFVRDVAPTAPIFGNIGVVQARETPTKALAEMLDACGADALCVHLNPAMEVVQPEGDQDFRGGLQTIRRLVEELPYTVIVKETGCGLSRSVAERLVSVGVSWVDVSGAGGTSWVGVEARRAEAGQRALGERYWDWGIPTAASVAQLSDLGLGIIATGGVSDGLMAAKAIALGATCAGIARPFLQAQARGRDALHEAVTAVIDELRLAHLLTGSRDGAALRDAPLVIGPRLARWVPRGSSLRARGMLD